MPAVFAAPTDLNQRLTAMRDGHCGKYLITAMPEVQKRLLGAIIEFGGP